MTTGSSHIARPEHTVPLRGTQSLVGVMVFVWRHPSLTAIEVVWRWLAAAPLLYVAWRTLAPTLSAIPLDTAGLESMTFFEPVRSVGVLVRQAELYRPALVQTGKWWIPLALFIWAVAAALGRNATLRRADSSTHPRFGPVALFSLLRGIAFLALLLLWGVALLLAVRHTVLTPARLGRDPNLVLLTALAVVLTLLAFLVWSLTVWALDLRMLQNAAHLPPATRQQRAQLRSKLTETNLVMGIVRVALLVLAMTFSASPLPFQSQETQAYINVWWIGVGLFYVLSSDYFHVVRRIAYLRFLQTIAGDTGATRRTPTDV